MEIVTWRGLASLARLALIGVGVAFACAILSLLAGFGSATAHADEGEERGLLGAVTNVVTDTTSLVGETVTGVASVATTVVSSVVPVVPAPVQQPVQAVVQTVSDVTAVVVAPVQQIASQNVVGAVTQPVVELVTQLPVVGTVVTELGVDTALTDVTAGVDDLLVTTVGALETTSSTIGSPRPVVDASLADPTAAAPPSTFAASVLTTSVFARTVASPTLAAHASTTAGIPDLWRTPSPVRDLSAPDLGGALCPSSVGGSATGGSSSGAWALVGLLPFAAHRAWVRRAGSADDDAPPAPFFATDVSPD